MVRIYCVLKSLLYLFWWVPLLAIPLFGVQYMLMSAIRAPLTVSEGTEIDDRSEELVGGYWSVLDREYLHSRNDVNEVRELRKKLSSAGTLVFAFSAGLLEQYAKELLTESESESGAGADIRSLLGDVRKMRFVNCGFTVGDWEIFSQLSDLEVVEFHGVKRTSEETSEEYVQSSAAALSRLPRLQTLLLTGESFAGVGRMPELRTLVLELRQVESFLAGDVAARFPRLETILIRIPTEGEVSAGVYARLRGVSQLREVHLWSGDAGSTGLLTRHLDNFRRQLPGLSVQRRDWGLSFEDKCLWVLLQLSLAAAAYFMLCGVLETASQGMNVVIPGVCRAHQQVLVMMYLLVAGAGVLLAWCLGVRAWLPVLAPILGMSLPTTLLDALPGRLLRQPMLLSGSLMLGFSVTLLIPAALYFDNLYLCAAMNGDDTVLNLVLLCLTAGTVLQSLPALRRMPKHLAEWGQTSLLVVVSGGTSGPGLPAVNSSLLQSDLADRLRSGTAMPVLKSLLFFPVMAGSQFLFFYGTSDLAIKSLKSSLYWLGFLPVMLIAQKHSIWQMHRSRLWSDFVLPCSRTEFWLALRAAVFRDLRWFYLAAILLPVAVVPFIHSGVEIRSARSVLQFVLVWVVGSVGVCAMHHGVLCRIVAGSWAGWVSGVPGVATIPLTICAQGLVIVRGEAFGPAAVLSLFLFLTGCLLQWKLRGWLESAEYPSKRIG
jgi:hypothetical protein